MIAPGHLDPDSAHAIHPLDQPVRASLTGAHSRFAVSSGGALRYPADVTSFVAPAHDGLIDADGWAVLRQLAEPGALLALFADRASLAGLPPGWQVTVQGVCLQMVATEALTGAPDPEAIELGDGDVPEMLDLVARTRPGPFEVRTNRMGTFLGLRRDGELVAMAGQRLRPPGWCEVSAVCTAPEQRGQGLAARLIDAIVADIRGRGETPFLHTWVTNVSAIGLYEKLGFSARRRVDFFAVRTPAEPASRPASDETPDPASDPAPGPA